MWEYNHTPESDELMHYGILGMKWGVRRTKAQLAGARRERKASLKAEKYLHKAELLKAKSKETRRDRKVAKLNAKGKYLAEQERIDQEYERDVQEAKSVKIGKTMVANALTGAVGGALVGTAAARSGSRSGKEQVGMILVGTGMGATLGTLKAMKTVRKQT